MSTYEDGIRRLSQEHLQSLSELLISPDSPNRERIKAVNLI